jgi:GTP-binding protein
MPTKIRLNSRSFMHLAKAGRASLNRPADGGMPDQENLDVLFDTIFGTIPAPVYHEGAPLQAHVTNLDSSPYLGRLALCRVREGVIKKGSTVAWMKQDGTQERVKISELLITDGLERVPTLEAGPGDIYRGRRYRDHHIGRDPCRC